MLRAGLDIMAFDNQLLFSSIQAAACKQFTSLALAVLFELRSSVLLRLFALVQGRIVELEAAFFKQKATLFRLAANL